MSHVSCCQAVADYCIGCAHSWGPSDILGASRDYKLGVVGACVAEACPLFVVRPGSGRTCDAHYSS